MSIVHIRHIKKSFDKEFLLLVDMTDYQGKPQTQVDDAFHSRAQAAYSLVVIAKLDPKIAAASVTDAYDDNGIDALCYDQDEKTLYLVQSKWHKNGQGSLESAACRNWKMISLTTRKHKMSRWSWSPELESRL